MEKRDLRSIRPEHDDPKLGTLNLLEICSTGRSIFRRFVQLLIYGYTRVVSFGLYYFERKTSLRISSRR